MADEDNETTSTLPAHDDQVLEAIFNPEAPACGLELGTGEEGGGGGGLVNGEGEEGVLSEEAKRAKEMEVVAVRAAEEGRLEEALETLTAALQLAPSLASGYNNRAQVHRLLGSNEQALRDLEAALALSRGRSRAAQQAFTQRALLRLLAGETEPAVEDFRKAALLGSRFAQSQLVRLNPYSALCNQMLSEAVTKLRTPGAAE